MLPMSELLIGVAIYIFGILTGVGGCAILFVAVSRAKESDDG